MRKHWRRYLEISRREQREAVVRVRAELRRSAPFRGSAWIGPLGCDELGRPELYNQWDEVRFLSRKAPKTIIWRAQIETASKRFWDTAGSIAFDRAWSSLSADEVAAMPNLKSLFEVCARSPTGKPLAYKVAHRSERPYERFSGRTLAEETARIEAELCESNDLTVYEQYVVDRSFEGAVGVRMVVDAPSITREVVDQIVDGFLAMGEIDWCSEVPVARHKLPVVTYDRALRTNREVSLVAKLRRDLRKAIAAAKPAPGSDQFNDEVDGES